MRILSICFLLAIAPFMVSAQSNSGTDLYAEKPCGSDEHHAFRMKTDAEYKTRHIRNNAALKAAISNSTTSSRDLPPHYTIPIVVHVIHLGESIGTGTNIPDAQILDAIDGLNDRFANDNGMGLDIEMSFCLANRDPNGCPTSGINRVDGSAVPNYEADGMAYSGGCGGDEIALKALSLWPVNQYYNIWVVHDICGDIAGFAYYPNGDWYDGTVIDVPSMNYSNRVLAHELGHGFNLHHTFSGDEDGTTCPQDSDCSDEGDEVCDTPPHRRNDCGLNNPCSNGGGVWDDSRYNWMSYCATEVALGRFTADQRIRLRATMLEWPRNELLSSPGCDNAESMRITSDDALMCSGEERTLTATPAGGIFAIADGPGSIEGDVLTATGGGIIVVEYIVSQAECSSSVFQAISSRQAPTSRLIPAADSLCVGETTTLRGIPSGGTFTVISGPGIIDTNELLATGAGHIELLYTVTILGCASMDEAVVVSNDIPEATIEFLTDDVLTAVPDTGVYQWVRCDLDYEPIEGGTNAVYVVSTSGSYAVVSLNGNCRDTSECVELEITSVDPGYAIDPIKLYPNPVSEMLYLEYATSSSPVHISIMDMQGKPVAGGEFNSQSKMGIDVSGFVAGVYVVAIEVEGREKFYYRFIKV